MTKKKVELDPQLIERGREYVRKRYGKSCLIKTIYKHASGGGEFYGWGPDSPSNTEREAFEAAIWKGNIIRSHHRRGYTYRWASDEELTEIRAKKRAQKALRAEETRKEDRLRKALQSCTEATPGRVFPNDPESGIDPDRFLWHGATIDVAGWEARSTVALRGVGEFNLDAEQLAEVVETGGDVIDAFRVAVEGTKR